MKKFVMMGAILAAGIFLASASWAEGRLNFMLINKTGHDIVDVKICPTGIPKYESENLLKETLDPNSRIYIGPNYYGEQNLWNIALKWKNGFEKTFTKLHLTRYNTYTVYSTPHGVKIRQTYVPAFAKYEFGKDAPSYMVGEKEKQVAVSKPEKLSASARPAKAVEPGNANARQRQLAFEDAYGQADAALKSTADTLALKTSVEVNRDGQTNNVPPTADFKPGDKVRLHFTANKDGHIYWLSRNDAGQYKILFPTGEDGNNSVVRNKEYVIPTVEPMQLGPMKGTETIFAVLSPSALPELEKAVQLSATGNLAEASKLISDLVNGHETKRTTQELVFEEEDDDDINTQSQLADGETPFVGTYELVTE